MKISYFEKLKVPEILRKFNLEISVQLAVSVKRYLLSPENLIEVSVMVLLAIILFAKDDIIEHDLKRIFAASYMAFHAMSAATLSRLTSRLRLRPIRRSGSPSKRPCVTQWCQSFGKGPTLPPDPPPLARCAEA